MPYKNKDDQAACVRRHYNRNKKSMKKRASVYRKIARKRNKVFLQEYLRAHPCVDCGESDIVVLDFDHVRGKKYKPVTVLSNNSSSIKKIQDEIDKCEVRCANCHRRKTALDFL